MDDHEIVLCSDRPGITGTHLQEEWFEKIKNADELRMELKQDSTVYTLMKRILPYQKCAIYALIDNDVALQDLYNMPVSDRKLQCNRNLYSDGMSVLYA